MWMLAAAGASIQQGGMGCWLLAAGWPALLAAGSKSVLSESNYWQSCIIHGFSTIYKKTYNTTTGKWFVDAGWVVCG